MRNRIDLVALLVVLALAACADRQAQLEDHPADPSAAYLALGDSYTIGEGVAPNERFPAQLVTLLRTRGENVAEPTVVATTGWTTDELLEAVAERDLQPEYDLVTLLIGVNDQYRGTSAETYAARFPVALGKAIELGRGDPENVVVLSIPDWGVSRFASEHGREPTRIARELDAYNEIARAITEARGAAWIDVTRFSREATDPSMFAADGLHPSAMAYGEWARLALPAARAALD